MGCCGDKRGEFYGRAPVGADLHGSAGSAAPSGRHLRFSIRFRYVGATGMTVVGPASRLRYRFDRHGAELDIDPRDRPGLAAVPNLREVR